MIAGSPTDGDFNRARKAHRWWLEVGNLDTGRGLQHGPSISFGQQDLEGVSLPHDDALVIRVTTPTITLPGCLLTLVVQ